MKIPKKLKVGGHFYKIFIVEADDQRKGSANWGKTIHHHKEIYLDKTAASTQKEETFFHETLHCIDQVYNGNEISEASNGDAIISRLAEGIYQVLKDNKLLK